MTKQITVGKYKYEKEAYWCNKCKKFHRYLAKNKSSSTHKEHFVYISRYKYEFSESELFKISFKKSWNREKERQANSIKKEGFINE